jgi:hypothetical protein
MTMNRKDARKDADALVAELLTAIDNSTAAVRGDEMSFKNIYTEFRLYNGVTDSVWKTLSYLYSNETADLLEMK